MVGMSREVTMEHSVVTRCRVDDDVWLKEANPATDPMEVTVQTMNAILENFIVVKCQMNLVPPTRSWNVLSKTDLSTSRYGIRAIILMLGSNFQLQLKRLAVARQTFKFKTGCKCQVSLSM